ncbi:hypothetical protein [Paenibacillus odorifer]|uniref:Uncharacterized protein n=1 Tax=Paenibacillus odorifer TaxID=189426 RepID=A0A1R0Y5F6_9BACL|nr:hypothetical protein [Paenibacillus odorifer]OMD42565.1 hypothetical protein BSK52_07080 [Paenibacillus odorifer]
MSLCICLQNSDSLLIAADTALTIKHEGRQYRFHQPFQKLVQVERFLIFMSGSADAALRVLEKFKAMEHKNVDSFQLALVEGCAEIARMYPDMYNSADPIARDAAAVVAEWTAAGPIVHLISPEDNFKRITRQVSASETAPHTAGYRADEAMDQIGTWLSKPDKPMGKAIQDVFENLSGEGIGGMLTVALMNEQGISFLPAGPIQEKVHLPYYEDFVLSQRSPFRGSISMIGSKIMTSEEGVFPRAEMSNTTRMFSVQSSENNRIEMRSVGSNELSELFFTTESAYASFSLPNEDTGLLGKGNNLTLEFGTIKLRGYSGVEVLGWEGLKTEAGRSLATELAALWTAINGKADASHSHSVSIPNHNHGNTANANSGGGTYTVS